MRCEVRADEGVEKAEKEEQAAMQAFLKQQEEAKAAAAALRREKQGKPAKVAPQAKRTKAQIKKAKEAMKREEEEAAMHAKELADEVIADTVAGFDKVDALREKAMEILMMKKRNLMRLLFQQTVLKYLET